MPGVPARVTRTQQHQAKEQKMIAKQTAAKDQSEEMFSYSPAPQSVRRIVNPGAMASPTILKNETQFREEDDVAPAQTRKLRTTVQAATGVMKLNRGASGLSEANGRRSIDVENDFSFKGGGPTSPPPSTSPSRQQPVMPASGVKRVSLVEGLGSLVARRASLALFSPGESADGAEARVSKLLKLGFSLKAREYLSVGYVDEAISIAQKDHDVIGWAAALTLAGDSRRAVDIIEAVVISSCLVVYQNRCRGNAKHSKNTSLNYTEVLEFILKGGDVGSAGSNGHHEDGATSPVLNATAAIIKALPPPKENDYREVILDVCSVLSYDEVHQWYLTAILLHSSFLPPTNNWLRHFFSLFLVTAVVGHMTAGSPGKPTPNKKGVVPKATAPAQPAKGVGALPQARQLSRADVEEILISQCTEDTLHAVNAYVCFQLGRFRTSLFSATEVLSRHNEDVCMRFVRCMCALKVCDRKTSAMDCTHLMHSESMIISTAGCALASYAIPMQAAREAVLGFRSQIYREELFVHSLMEWTHALTLTQLGDFESAKRVATDARRYSPPKSVRELIDDVLLVCCIALKDQESLLKLHLTPARQLHCGMVPAFGGGYDNGSINTIPIDSDLADFINPMRVASIADVRKMIATHTTRARSLFSYGNLKEAFQEVTRAVGCSEELIGSTEFSFSDLAPHRVFFLAINIGLALLDRLIEGSPDFDPSDPEAVAMREEDDQLGDEVISTLRSWARRLRRFHPRTVVGPCAVAQVAIASQEESSLARAQELTAKFPNYVLAQNCVSTALYALHLIPDAVANAQRTLQRFPHVPEVKAMYLAVAGKDGLYSFLYRGVVRLTFVQVDSTVSTKRVRVVLLLTVVHFIIFFFMFAVNFPFAEIPRLEQLEGLANSLTVPLTFGLFWAQLLLMLYTVIMIVTPRNLVSVLLTDIFVRDTTLNRFLYTSRSLPLVNMAHAMLITVYGDNFGLHSSWYTLAMYTVLWLMYFPFTSRAFLLRSVDEPKMAVPFWITLILTDIVLSPLLAVPTVLAVVVEPFMAIAFCAFIPESIQEDFIGDVAERLANNVAKNVDHLKKQRSITSGSEFIHIRFMRFLFRATHSEMETTYLLKIQQDEDDMRVFPLIHISEQIEKDPLPPPRKRSKTSMELQDLVDQAKQKMLAEEKKQKQKEKDKNASGGKSDAGALSVNSDEEDDREWRGLGARTDSFGEAMIAALNSEFDKPEDAGPGKHVSTDASKKSNTKRAVIGDTGLFAERRDSEAGDMFAMGGMLRKAQTMRKRQSRVGTFGHRETPHETSDAEPSFETPAAQFMQERRASNRRATLFMDVKFDIEDDEPTDPPGAENGEEIDSSEAAVRRLSVGREPIRMRVPRTSFDSDAGKGSPYQQKKRFSALGTPLDAAQLSSVGSFTSTGSDLSPSPPRPAPRTNTAMHFAQRHANSAPRVESVPDSHSVAPDLKDAKKSTQAELDAFAAFASDVYTFEKHSSVDMDTNLHSNDAQPPSKNPLVPPSKQKTSSDVSPSLLSATAPEIEKEIFELDIPKVRSKSPPHTTEPKPIERHRPAPISTSPPRIPDPKIAEPKLPEPGADRRPTVSPHQSAASSQPSAATHLSGVRGSPSRVTQLQTPKSAPPGDVASTKRTPLAVSPSGPVSPSMLSVHAAPETPKISNFFDTDDDEDDADGKPPGPAGKPPLASSRAPSTGTQPQSRKSFVKPGPPGPPEHGRQRSISPQPVRAKEAPPQGAEVLQLGWSDDECEQQGPLLSPHQMRAPSIFEARAARGFQLQPFVEPDDDRGVVNGNVRMRKVIDEFRQQRASTQQHLRTCDDEETILFLRRSLAAAKTKFIAEAAKIAGNNVIQLDVFELRKMVMDVFLETFKEGDGREANPELMATLFITMHTPDMTAVLISKKWLQECVTDDMPFFFGVFLSHRSVYESVSLEQMKWFLQTCPKSKKFRVDFLLFLFAMARKSRMCYENFKSLAPLWQSAFETVVSIAHLHEGESRQFRADLLENALMHPYICVDPNLESSSDRQTVFSRACREGDVPLVKYLLDNKLIKDLNRVQSDGTNALQQATARNMVAIVLLLCQDYAKQIAPSCIHVLKGGRGTALDIAISAQGDKRIENTLRTIDITHVGGEHLRSANGNKSLEEIAAANRAAAAQQEGPPKDATGILKVAVATLRPLVENLKECEKGNRTEEAKHAAALVETNKKSLAQRLEKLGPVLEVTADDVRDATLSFIDSLILEGDSRPINGQLVAVICKSMATSLSLPSQAVRRLWLCRSAESGSISFFRSFMTMRGMEAYLAQPKYDSVISDILKYLGCCKYLRIDMTREILHHAEVLCLDDRLDYLEPFWAKLFLGMIPTYESRKIAEVRTHRQDLVLDVLKMPHSVKWDMHAEVMGTEHSTFSKSCAEGDEDFVRFCFQSGMVSKEQANSVLSTGLTPLMHAVAKKREGVVKVMAQYAPRLVDVDVRTPFGSAIEMANLSGAKEIAKVLTAFSTRHKK
jgi:hypothetical protein